jgi:hypothetical protein
MKNAYRCAAGAFNQHNIIYSINRRLKWTEMKINQLAVQDQQVILITLPEKISILLDLRVHQVAAKVAAKVVQVLADHQVAAKVAAKVVQVLADHQVAAKAEAKVVQVLAVALAAHLMTTVEALLIQIPIILLEKISILLDLRVHQVVAKVAALLALAAHQAAAKAEAKVVQVLAVVLAVHLIADNFARVKVVSFVKRQEEGMPSSWHY